jgi:nucleoside-diphosphate-sugar epimerase
MDACRDENMKILITGGGGFLGSNLAKYISENTDHEIITIGRSKLNRELFSREIYYDYDLTNYDTCLYFTKDIDWVFDFAAIAGNYKFLFDNAAEIMYKNVQINSNILEASRINKVEKILFASSSAVYPTIMKNAFKEEDDYPLNPENRFYGLEKAYMESLYYLYQKKYNMKIYLPRISVNYGIFIPYSGIKSKSFAEICKRIIEIKNGETLELYGDGNQSRDMIYSEDCAEGLFNLINSDIHEPINISTGIGITINRLVGIATKYLNKSIKISYDIKKNMGVQNRISDNTKIKTLLKWEPKTIPEEGVGKMITWMKSEMKL